MTNRSPNHFGLTALDGVAALVVTVATVLYEHHSLRIMKQIYAGHIRLVDAGFGICFVIIWQYCYSVLNLYDRHATIPRRMFTIAKGAVTMTILVTAHLRLFHPGLLSVGAVGLVFLSLWCYETYRVAFSEWLLDQISSRNPQQVLILGSGRRAGKAWREIRTRHYSSIKFLGFVDDRSRDEMGPDVAARFLGNLDDLSDLLLAEAVDVILVAMPIQSCYPLMQRAVTIAESVGVRVIYLQDIYSTKRLGEDANQELFQELLPRHEHYVARLAVKRLVDIIGAITGLVLLSPVLLATAIGVKYTSPGPILFRQERYGYRRRLFRMMKFRSMVHDAEARLVHLESYNEADGPIFKMKNDPRVTRFGKFLRTSSLDELPQLWNVLIGDMSLVGPRPMSVRDVSRFNEATLMRRFSVKPGITGLWQVNGRSGVSFDQWIHWDCRYIDRWSLLLDFKIMLRTVTAVLKRSGAM